jgi:hypothetical protein
MHLHILFSQEALQHHVLANLRSDSSLRSPRTSRRDELSPDNMKRKVRYAIRVQRLWRARMARQYIHALRQEKRCRDEVQRVRQGIEVECNVCEWNLAGRIDSKEAAALAQRHNDAQRVCQRSVCSATNSSDTKTLSLLLGDILDRQCLHLLRYAFVHALYRLAQCVAGDGEAAV